MSAVSSKPIVLPAPSDAARKAKQLVFLALLDYYDEAKKSYKPGHTDASLAQQCGCAEEFVRKVRETDFGPLVEPNELKALRAELATAVATVADIGSRLDKLCQRNGWIA